MLQSLCYLVLWTNNWTELHPQQVEMISVLAMHKYCLDIRHQISAIKKQDKLIFQHDRLVHYFLYFFF